MKLPSRARNIYTLALVAGITLAIGWCQPLSIISPICGWLFAALIYFLISISAITVPGSKSPLPFYGPLFVCGTSAIGIAFYWLFFTIKDFGGFGPLASGCVYSLFVAGSSLQFLIFGLLSRRLLALLNLQGSGYQRPQIWLGPVLVALAWTAAETVSVRIFPWRLGHMQLTWQPLAQIADLGGVPLISLMVMLIAGLLVSSSQSIRTAIVAAGLTATCVTYGAWQMQSLASLPSRHLSVALVQANVSTEQRQNMTLFVSNQRRYQELSLPHAAENTLLIWPESVVQSWIPDAIRSNQQDRRLPRFPAPAPILFGSLSSDEASEPAPNQGSANNQASSPSQKVQQRYFNSAIAQQGDGSVLKPYHKRILMPFGEYVPLVEYLPFLRFFTGDVGSFTPGEVPAVFPFTIDGQLTPVSPLICYEDVVPQPARESTIQGAELLVNLTNDAWFGNTVAQYQHHLIAAFRAIENRRTLLRSTNTGLTAIVDPLGSTIASLTPFSEGTLLASAPLLSYKTIYSKYVGEFPWMVISILVTIFSLLSSLAAHRRSRI